MIEIALKKRQSRASIIRKKRRKGEVIEEEGPQLDTDLNNLPPVQAMRSAFLLKYGTLGAVWRFLDNNGSGSLSFTEFADGIEQSGLDYKTITGVENIKELFMIFDSDGSNDVSLVEFIGYPEVDDLPKDRANESSSTMWKRYINNVKLSPMAITREAKWRSKPPLHYDLVIE